MQYIINQFINFQELQCVDCFVGVDGIILNGNIYLSEGREN